MSAVVEPSGAQLLPPAEDQRQTHTAWQAHLCCDGDQRTKYPEWRDLAASLAVTL